MIRIAEGESNLDLSNKPVLTEISPSLPSQPSPSSVHPSLSSAFPAFCPVSPFLPDFL